MKRTKREKLRKKARRVRFKHVLGTICLFLIVVISGSYLGVLMGVYARPYLADFGSGLTPPTAAIVAHQAAAPVELIIPKISVDAKVESVGVNASGNMQAPSTFHTVAWYDKGAAPGEPGAAVIVGHLDNALGLDGVFYHLDQLSAGDSIVVKDAAGTAHAFTVERIARYPYNDAPTQEIFQADASSSELNLITCSGSWLQAQKTYNERLVVYAILDQNSLAANY